MSRIIEKSNGSLGKKTKITKPMLLGQDEDDPYALPGSPARAPALGLRKPAKATQRAKPAQSDMKPATKPRSRAKKGYQADSDAEYVPSQKGIADHTAQSLGSKRQAAQRASHLLQENDAVFIDFLSEEEELPHKAAKAIPTKSKQSRETNIAPHKFYDADAANDPRKMSGFPAKQHVTQREKQYSQENHAGFMDFLSDEEDLPHELAKTVPAKPKQSRATNIASRDFDDDDADADAADDFKANHIDSTALKSTAVDSTDADEMVPSDQEISEASSKSDRPHGQGNALLTEDVFQTPFLHSPSTGQSLLSGSPHSSVDDDMHRRLAQHLSPQHGAGDCDDEESGIVPNDITHVPDSEAWSDGDAMGQDDEQEADDNSVVVSSPMTRGQSGHPSLLDEESLLGPENELQNKPLVAKPKRQYLGDQDSANKSKRTSRALSATTISTKGFVDTPVASDKLRNHIAEKVSRPRVISRQWTIDQRPNYADAPALNGEATQHWETESTKFTKFPTQVMMNAYAEDLGREMADSTGVPSRWKGQDVSEINRYQDLDGTIVQIGRSLIEQLEVKEDRAREVAREYEAGATALADRLERAHARQRADLIIESENVRLNFVSRCTTAKSQLLRLGGELEALDMSPVCAGMGPSVLGQLVSLKETL